ncbi:hypothetical protein S7711_07237 [Stachybotrys chartarum IBT 7711]|uniref:Uncharacterized protein n=1 Tax=Stachybotrys chartarum (strain CBS 109288 / IBT 7711) TaxID=1280523 RepID=A0A084AGR0_STACB|nr:hypothetical protein S7711_07237 [Stachybotrys chartarum IBT 7711]
MAQNNGQGRIPLDDMRPKPSYSQIVANGKEPRHISTGPQSRGASSEARKGEKEVSDFHPVTKSKVLSSETLPHNSISALPVDRDEEQPASRPNPDSGPTKGNPTMEFLDCGLSEETHPQPDVQQLHRQIQILTTERYLAEEKAERAAERIEEMKRFMQRGISDIDHDTEGLLRDAEKLKEENKILKEQVNDAQSHIFSLQPYRKELTPDEVGRDYDSLVEGIQDWTQKLMEPFLENPIKSAAEILTVARKRPNEAARFRKTLQQYPDLIQGSMYPETDEDIVAAVILRFVHDNIFQKILYGSVQDYTRCISDIEHQMQINVEPKRDLFSIRTWTGEAYNALLSAPNFRSVRDRRRRDLTIELGNILRILCPKDRFIWLCENLEENCITPSMKLYEKLQVSTHHFYLDVNPFVMTTSGGDIVRSQDFLENIEKLDCRNILQNRKAFSLAKLDPPPSKKELLHDLLNVCTVMPALYMRQIGRRDAIKEPTIVRRQQILTAWGSDEKRQKFVDEGDRTVVAQLYFMKPERAESSFLRW